MAAPNLIIGLGHRKRVGKDTFAGFLDEALSSMGWWVIKLPFALRMKEVAHDLFQWSGLGDALLYECNQDLKESALPALGKSARQVWIEFADALRAIHPDVWIHNLSAEISWHQQELRHNKAKRKIAFIIPDVRFPNEAAAIKSWGGLLFKVVRPDAPVGDDIAENALADYTGWDDIINNDAGLGELLAEASWAAQRLHTHACRDRSPIPFIGDLGTHEKE